MTEPTPSPLDARISELATGFALGDLTENELRELYDLLRNDDGSGAHAARIAWETLGTVTDIRSQVSSSFQDTLAHRLSHETSRSGGFTARLLGRLGFRAPTLHPVEAPPAPVKLRIALWLLIAACLGAILTGGIALIWTQTHRARATVTGLHGSAAIGGQALTPGAEVDHRSLVVKAGGILTLAWDDGSIATITNGDHDSEAVATVRSNGLALLRGQAAIHGRNGFTITLPDRTGQITQDDTQFAAEVLSQRSFIGVLRGSLLDDKHKKLLQQHDGSGPLKPFRWQWSWDENSGTLASGNDSPSDWLYTGVIAWSDLNDVVRFTCTTTPMIEIKTIPGQLMVSVDGKEHQRLILAGSPLLATSLTLRQQDHSTLIVAVGELALTIPLNTSITGYHIDIMGKARVQTTSFYPLPTPIKK